MCHNLLLAYLFFKAELLELIMFNVPFEFNHKMYLLLS